MLAIMEMRILIVDDDPGLRELLQRYLTDQGYSVAGVEDGVSMDKYLLNNTVDLIVLDLMLPGEDGLAIAGRLSKSTHIPIIILSARGEDIDRIVGLEVGADDYLAKPFNPRELLARIRAVLRRQQAAAEDSKSEPSERKTYDFGPFRLHLGSRILMRDGEETPLTSGEYTLLEALVEHPNRVLSRDALIGLLKGYERSPFDRSVDVRITRLRHKIEPDPKMPTYIRTIWGAGYMFTPQGTAPKT